MTLLELIRVWLMHPIGHGPPVRCAGCDRVRTPEGPMFISGPSVYLCALCAADALVRIAPVAPGTGAAASPVERIPTRCSFCGRQVEEARGLLGLAHAAICRDCIELTNEVFARDSQR